MKTDLSKQSIIQKTVAIGGTTLVSRILGIIRELLLVAYLGASSAADAFNIAFLIPNSLRKIFAEGALSAAFIPTLVTIVKKKRWNEASGLISLSFIFFESIVIGLCIITTLYPETVIYAMAPGFDHQQTAHTAYLLTIVMPFIFFISSSALLAGALQSVGYFFIPAAAPVLLNIILIGTLLASLTWSLPIEWLCYSIIGAGSLQLLLHIIIYLQLPFSFGFVTEQSWHHLATILKKFIPCLFSMSIVEISLIIDTQFASTLPAGSVSLLKYANRFMGIPLGVLAVAFSTILLPHFSRISIYAPKRLGFYLLESAKLIAWVMLPIALIMGFFSEKIFLTLFLKEGKFSLMQVDEAATILIFYLGGLFFFSFNKIILNSYYALHDTRIPMVISIITTICNYFLNSLLINSMQTAGLAFATTCTSGILQTVLLLAILQHVYHLPLYVADFGLFITRYSIQLSCFMLPFYGIYTYLHLLFTQLPAPFNSFFITAIGFWLWTAPLCLLLGILVYSTRKWFAIQLHFLN